MNKFIIRKRKFCESISDDVGSDFDITQSINQNLYNAPSRSVLRSAPDPGQVEKNSLEKVVELRTGAVWEVS